MPPSLRAGVPLAAALLCPLSAQVDWTQRSITERGDHALAYDPVRLKMLVFGGTTLSGAPLAPDFAEWNWNWYWSRLNASPAPGTRSHHAMTTDSARARVVLFGGRGFNDTWEWDGTRWLLQTPAVSPPAGSGVMAYDTVRQRSVLVQPMPPRVVQTWEWDGTNWTRHQPAASPSHVLGLAYDQTRQRTVLVEKPAGQSFLDTWEWDGTSWTLVALSSRPPARQGTAMAYDAQRQSTLLASSDSLGLMETWTWDGTAWTLRQPANRPPARWGHALAYDPVRSRAVLFAGWDSFFGEHSDTWEWNGTDWLLADAGAPAARDRFGFAFDERRGVALLYGGESANRPFLGDMWTWDGTRWSQQTASLTPPARTGPALAHRGTTGHTLLFGGHTLLGGPTADTFLFNGTQWGQLAPPQSPRARADHALAYDASRDRVVLFGGVFWNLPLGDTWEWDGTTWIQHTPNPAPPAGSGYGMAYDERRQRTVLYQGTGTVWEWDGTQWQSYSSGPSLQSQALVYDRARGRVVLQGTTWASNAETWEWDGTSWQQRTTPGVPPARGQGGRCVYYSPRNQVVLFGGRMAPNGGWLQDTWEYAPTTPASYVAFLGGCPGSAGTPLLTPLPLELPWLGGTFTREAAPLPQSSIAALAIGLSNTSWGGTPLPFPLATVGMPGCQLHTSSDWVFTMTPAGAGRARHTLTIPPDPRLLGVTTYEQAFVVDPGVNSLGVVVSRSSVAYFGGK